MPLTVSKLLGKTAEADLDIEGEKLHVVYRPGALTPALESELRKWGEKSEGWADLLVHLLVSWDLQGDGGKPVPIEFVRPTPAKMKDGKELEPEKPASGALMDLPGWFLATVVTKIREDMSPNRKTDEPTGGSS